MKFAEEHLQKLREYGHEPQTWVGGKLRSYAVSVARQFKDCDASELPVGEVDRNFLFDLIENRKASIGTCCVAVLGWGGMRRDHARAVLSNASHWLPIVEEIRGSKLSRTEAYREFKAIRASGYLPGMGPAFFTKLIYFFGRGSASRGYIMDQWTARSANLLLSHNLVGLRHTKAGSWVTDHNTEADYENFCLFIENLAAELAVETDAAEERIFSIGSRGRKDTRGAWRRYVMEHG